MNAVVIGPGRMGRAIAEELEERGHTVLAILGRGECLETAASAEIAFEFTSASSSPQRVMELLECGIPTVCGTTGFDPEGLRSAATERRVPLVIEPNFSLAVAVLRHLVREGATRFRVLPEYEAGVFERHHNQKRDAPSGTALALCAIARQAGGREVPAVSLRLGGQPGEHTVVFDGPDESLELVHRARSRRLFAAGAVRAAQWLLVQRPSGAVRLDDLLEATS